MTNPKTNEEATFGTMIRQARKGKGFSQRKLAEILELDFTYLSKLENDRAKYAPKEEIIRELAHHLELNAEELIYLSGRLPQQEEDTLKQHYKAMPSLFRRMRENPEWAQKVLQEVMEGQN